MPPTPRIPSGAVLDVAEADYLFGVGPLRLRVTEVGGVESCHGTLWRRLRGVPILWNGREDVEREVWVKVSALRGLR